MVDKARADQIAGGVFLIGLAILFMTDIVGFFPGILFVIGASSIARGVAEGRDWYSVPGGLWMIGLGLLFLFQFQWPMILILIGVSMLFGKGYMGHRDSEEKAKHAPQTVTVGPEKIKNDSYIIDESASDDETTVEDVLKQNTSNH